MRVLLIYRNKHYGKAGVAALGLGVNCRHTLSVLKRLGISACAEAVWTPSDIHIVVAKHSPDYAIIEAPWVSTDEILNICKTYPNTHFLIRCHSNLAFLQVEPGAINLIRETILYSESMLNLNMASNSKNFCDFIEQTYHGQCVYLPNLYDMERVERKRIVIPNHVLKCGSFSAIRLQKNLITGAGASLLLARRLGLDLEFHMISDGTSGGKAEVAQAIQNLFTGLSWAKVIVHPWKPWPLFRRIVADMNIAFHLSSTETFSISTADCLAECVPVVGSAAIDWLPPSWIANLDDPGEAASVGSNILHDYRTPDIGLRALRNVCASHELEWLKVFGPGT